MIYFIDRVSLVELRIRQLSLLDLLEYYVNKGKMISYMRMGLAAIIIKSRNQSYFPSVDYNKIKTFHSHLNKMSTTKLTAKESFLLKKLTTRITMLSQFMQAQGLSSQDVNDFVLRCVFEVPCSQQVRSSKLSKDFSSETEQETNSEASEWSWVEISLQKVLIQKVTDGTKMDKVLLGYLEKCCLEQDKLKNYLKSEQINATSKRECMIDFEKLKQKIGLTKNRKSRYQATQISQLPQLYPINSHISSIRERIQQVKQRSLIQESQRELDYMRSFEKSLSQSIRKTKLLRTMLEKQLASEFSPLSMLNGDDDEVGREIY